VTRQDAVDLLWALPASGGSLLPCEQVNPALLIVWSRLMERRGGASVWTELDVAERARLMLLRHINAAVSPREGFPNSSTTRTP